MTSYKTLYEGRSSRPTNCGQRSPDLQARIALGPDDLLRELERTRQIVDLAGIARHMLVERFTPQQWKQRDHLPPVDFPEIKEHALVRLDDPGEVRRPDPSGYGTTSRLRRSCPPPPDGCRNRATPRATYPRRRIALPNSHPGVYRRHTGAATPEGALSERGTLSHDATAWASPDHRQQPRQVHPDWCWPITRARTTPAIPR